MVCDILGKVEHLHGGRVAARHGNYAFLTAPLVSVLIVRKNSMLKHVPFYASLLGRQLSGETKAQQSHVLLYGAIEAHSFGEKGCIASNALLAKETGYSEGTIKNSLSELREAGWVSATYDDLGNRMQIIPLLVIDTPQSPPGDPPVTPRLPPRHLQVNRGNIIGNSKNYFSAKNDLPSDDDITTVAVDDWGEEYIKPQRKNPQTDEVINYFKKECLKHVGKNPAVALSVARKMVVAAREYLTDDQIKRMFDDWFRIGLPDNETMQITRALSTARINTFKADNGIK